MFCQQFKITDLSCNTKLWIGIAVGSIPVLYMIRKYFQGGQFRKRISAIGKVVVITGGNTGIGKETALHLAKEGATVYIACRNVKKTEETINYIIKQTGNRNLINMELDLASLESIRNFVKQFLQKEKQLDILINNAGVYGISDRMLTANGFEMTFAVNHLGHFLLTNLLLDTLKSSAPSKIINVSSKTHYYGKIDKNNLNGEIEYNYWSAYCQSKLANILFTRELAKRLTNSSVRVNSLHPGVVRTEITRSLPFHKKLVYLLLYFFIKTSKSGAQTTLAIALDPDYEQITGKYFTDCKIICESNEAQDDQMAEWLWQKSEQFVKLNK